MAKIPDPFEPWRPPGDKPSPPVPAPTVREQPILTPPARVAPAPRTVSLLAPVFLAAVAILGLIMLIVHPQGHAPRVLGAVALLGVGLGLGLLFAHKRRWRAALIWASGG
ncbi:MAG TPA: hypothetical protein VEL76_12805, partial [Gemmataceae bacterium]|nr:hypothetical protein [Gemmataceae bacterium]